MTDIKRANKKDSRLLSEISIRSEAYWGNNAKFMEKFELMYKVTEDFIHNNPTYILTERGENIGFYGLLVKSEEISLEYLFIEPKYIGKGFGKKLWNHMIEECKKLNIEEFTLVTSPQAIEFYKKLGAVECGEVESLINKECKIPKLIYKLN